MLLSDEDDGITSAGIDKILSTNIARNFASTLYYVTIANLFVFSSSFDLFLTRERLLRLSLQDDSIE